MRNLLTIAAVVSIQATVQAQQPQRPTFGCTKTEHRQFDFWIGEWTVTNPAGQPIGKNTIKAIQDGCALQEEWTGGQGGTGISLNFFDAGRWHQLWVANQSGAVLRLIGGLEDGAMVMRGESLSPTGPVHNRIRWERIDSSRVRQTWDISVDRGKTWKISFQGVYTRRPAGARISEEVRSLLDKDSSASEDNRFPRPSRLNRANVDSAAT